MSGLFFQCMKKPSHTGNGSVRLCLFEESGALSVQPVGCHHTAAGQPAGRVGKADHRKGFLADKVADNDGIRRVVHHLKQISQHQRKRKENDLQGRTPRNALRIGSKYRFIDD